MKDNGQYESNYFIIKISHDNVYFIIFDKFSSFIKMHKTLSLRAISPLPKMCTILEKIVSVYGIFFFLVTFIIEESREKQIIKTKLDIQ